MKPEDILEKLQTLKAELENAQECRKTWSLCIKHLQKQINAIIDGEEIDQLDFFDNLPPRPKVPE